MKIIGLLTSIISSKYRNALKCARDYLIKELEWSWMDAVNRDGPATDYTNIYKIEAED